MWRPALAAMLIPPAVPCAAAQRPPVEATVSGRVTVLERDGKRPEDLGSAVVWLSPVEPPAAPAGRSQPPRPAQVVTEKREFRPRVLVVSVGTTVSFPNHDPFNHNIFSSQPAAFDLGLYGRGDGPQHQFTQPRLVRLFCNIHPRMSAFVQVVDTPHSAQPGPDGSFTLSGVHPGAYTLHAWHERAAAEVTREVVVPAAGLRGVTVDLDARGYKFEQHLNKYGKPYGRARERY